MPITHDSLRLTLAGFTGVTLLLSFVWAAVKRTRVATGPIVGLDDLVLYASQTGQAEAIANLTAARLKAGGHKAAAVSARDVTTEALTSCKRLLVVAATAGEGEAPDDAWRFEHDVMSQTHALSGIGFAILALGDRSHGHFCAFGHRLDAWLQACNAQPLRPCLEVDDLDPAALAQWEAFLGGFGAGVASGDADTTFWRLKARHVLNPDSPAQKLYQIDLVPDGALPAWQAGDLAEIVTPNGRRRDYSIASLPAEGILRLYVRQVVHDDGTFGEGSGRLTEGLQPHDRLKLRLKPHGGFHAPDGNGPLLLIGAGSGLAGLRAHILQARARRRPCRLIYGERSPDTDGALCEDMQAWAADGTLARLDLAFSAPATADGRYVQHVLAESDARSWLGGDGSLMVCGGLDMGKGVEAVLRDLMGGAWVNDAIASGRYRRDLY
jgi:sulfite reductase (NADPH) flavoprotein alpha-component